MPLVKVYGLLVVMQTFVLIFGSVAYGFDCVSNTYADEAWAYASTDFDIGQEIYLGISCTDLPVGEYRAHVNWIKEGRGVVRNDLYDFSIKEKKITEFHFWMKPDRQKFFKRFLNGGDFDNKMLGIWYVECYMNNVLIDRTQFTYN